MTTLTIYDEGAPGDPVTTRDAENISRALRAAGVVFERWATDESLAPDADQTAVLRAYRSSVARLMEQSGFASADVVSLRADSDNIQALRQKFLSEHTHSEDEVRFFVDGCGLFYIHAVGKVYGLLCDKGDLIRIPAGIKHWFDMGAAPNFKCIRLFTNPEGWVAQFTGSNIADAYPRMAA